MDKLDVLNRDTFVEQLVRLMNNLSDNKSSTCFAINGAWGCGKSFLLDIFEERLGEIQSENTSKDKYFVVRYNSWKYDYYEEPLVAIVSTMISIVEEKTKLFPSSQRREEILGILKSAGVVLLSMADEVVKNKIVFNAVDIAGVLPEGKTHIPCGNALCHTQLYQSFGKCLFTHACITSMCHIISNKKLEIFYIISYF